MDAKTVLISGYYGFGNSGDEAVLWSILTALRECESEKGRLRPVVLSADPEGTKRLYGVEAVPRMNPRAVWTAVRNCDALISGGGSLLQDVTGPKTIPYYLGIIRLAQWLGKPVFVYAQGIGPVHRPIFRPMMRNILRKCTYLSVRDGESADFLVGLGIPADRVEVVPDPVMGVSGQAASADRNRADGRAVIGVSVRFWNPRFRELDALAEALAGVASERKVMLRFLPFHLPGDREASLRVMEKIDEKLDEKPLVSLAETGEHPADMIAEVAKCDVLVGMRLHSLIYAATRGVPMVGISYDPKIDRFMHSLNLEPSTTADRPDAERIRRDVLDRLCNGKQWIEENRERFMLLSQKSRIPAQQICQYLRI